MSTGLASVTGSGTPHKDRMRLLPLLLPLLLVCGVQGSQPLPSQRREEVTAVTAFTTLLHALATTENWKNEWRCTHVNHNNLRMCCQNPQSPARARQLKNGVLTTIELNLGLCSQGEPLAAILDGLTTRSHGEKLGRMSLALSSHG